MARVTPTKVTPRAVRLTLDSGRKSDSMLLNAGYDEGNTDAEGGSVPDYYPDYIAGDRIDPTDVEIRKASLRLSGIGRARWKLLFPAGIKVWIAVQGKYKKVLSGVASAEVLLPQKMQLLLEGIQESRTPDDVKLVAVLTPTSTPNATPTKSHRRATDAVSLTIRSGGGMSMGGAAAGSPGAGASVWSNWPACSPDWAQGEARFLKSGVRRPPPARGNGLPTVTITSPTFGALFTDLIAITGTAKPANKNTVIKRVELILLHHVPRSGETRYWDGARWVTDPVITPMLVANYQNGRWVRKTALPSGLTLTSGTYGMEVRAYDNFDQWGYVRTSFVIDRDPELTVTTPVHKASVPAFNTITGTVKSIALHTPITEVKVRLSRYANPETGSQQEYWNGTSWVTEPPPPLPTIYSTPTASDTAGRWQVETALPPAPTLTEGTYRVIAAASDRAGNVGCTESQFLVWRRPTLTITTPKSRTGTPGGKITMPTLRLIEGTVELIPGGTPVTAIKVQLERLTRVVRSEYWNGTAWTPPPAASLSGTSTPSLTPSLPAIYIAPSGLDTIGRWKVEASLPTDTTLPEGDYLVFAQAYNDAAVVAREAQAFRIYRGPHITVSWPTRGAVIATLDAAHPVYGTAQPGVTGAPIVSVVMSLNRTRPTGGYESWNGTTWVTTSTKALETKWTPPTGSNAPGTWKRDFGWPPAEDLYGRSYMLTAGAQDKEGRGTTVTISFRVKQKARAR